MDCDARLSPDGTHYIHAHDCERAIELDLPRDPPRRLDGMPYDPISRGPRGLNEIDIRDVHTIVAASSYGKLHLIKHHIGPLAPHYLLFGKAIPAIRARTVMVFGGSEFRNIQAASREESWHRRKEWLGHLRSRLISGGEWIEL